MNTFCFDAIMERPGDCSNCPCSYSLESVEVGDGYYDYPGDMCVLTRKLVGMDDCPLRIARTRPSEYLKDCNVTDLVYKEMYDELYDEHMRLIEEISKVNTPWESKEEV